MNRPHTSSTLIHPLPHETLTLNPHADTTDPPFTHTRYAEKNGDTNMHKARLGLLPADGSAVLLLSNLGGSMGGELTALKVRVGTHYSVFLVPR